MQIWNDVRLSNVNDEGIHMVLRRVDYHFKTSNPTLQLTARNNVSTLFF